MSSSRLCPLPFILVLLLFTACGDASPTDHHQSDGDYSDSETDAETATEREISLDGDTPADGDVDLEPEADLELEPDLEPEIEPPEPLRFTAVTYNTGTTEGMGHDNGPDDGYTEAHALISDEWYGDGLAWLPAVADVTAFFSTLDPDIVVFQEIFWTGECPGIPEDAKADFICSEWQPGDPTVAQQVLGAGWQIMCHLGKPDKCAAVKRSFGSFRDCAEDFCLEGLEGYKVDDCGSGSRIGRGVIDLVEGGVLTLINVHGSSGITRDDQGCREKQFMQVFEDFGDGAPAANGEYNLVLGDFNTDPARMDSSDASARKVNEHTGDGKRFHFHTEVGMDAPATYAGIFNIDHVLSDSLSGACWHAGISYGHALVSEAKYFDHAPAVCELEMKAGD